MNWQFKRLQEELNKLPHQKMRRLAEYLHRWEGNESLLIFFDEFPENGYNKKHHNIPFIPFMVYKGQPTQGKHPKKPIEYFEHWVKKCSQMDGRIN